MKEDHTRHGAMYQMVVWGLAAEGIPSETVAKCAADLDGVDVLPRLVFYNLNAKALRARQRNDDAIGAAETGIQLADTCGFTGWSIELRLECARAHLAAGCPEEAVAAAKRSLDMSEEADCLNAWASADSLHLLGVAWARMGNNAEAARCLKLAADKRKRLGHLGLRDTQDELDRVRE